MQSRIAAPSPRLALMRNAITDMFTARLHSVTVAPGESRANSFDGLRLAGAAAVLVGHSFDLTGRPEPAVGPNALGTLGVLMFFGISGFLITQSWLREPSVVLYFVKRGLRILPALVVAIVLTACVIGPLVSTLSPKAYFWSADTWKYVLTNIVLATHFTLPGVFAHNPYPDTVNGSIWTLPHEAHAYVIIAGLGMTGLLGRRVLASGALVALVALATRFPSGVHGIGNPHFLTAFGAGALLYLWRDKVTWRAYIAATLTALAVVVARSNVAGLTMDLVLPYDVVYVAYRLPNIGARLTAKRDLSYGLYVWAFPVEQLVAHWWTHVTWWQMVLSSTPAVLVLALASWHVVEHPALRLKRRLERNPVPSLARRDATPGAPG